MKSVIFLSLVALGYGQQQPQRPGGACPCPDVICPNNGRDACECMNRAAQDCFRTWELRRNPYCQRPQPLDCNAARAGQNPRPQPSNGFTTYYSEIPYRTTITTVLPGFGWPSPVTSYSYSVSTTTITLVNPQNQPGSGWVTVGPSVPYTVPSPYQFSDPPRRTTTITLGGYPGGGYPTPPPPPNIPNPTSSTSSSTTSSGWFDWLTGRPSSSSTLSPTTSTSTPSYTYPPYPQFPSYSNTYSPSYQWPPPAPPPPTSTPYRPPPPPPRPTSSSSSPSIPPWLNPASPSAPPPWVTSSSSSTLPPWSRPSDQPWSVPPPPPPGWVPGDPLPSSSTTTSSIPRPPPWHPPNGNGGSWTPIAEPTLPTNAPPKFTPVNPATSSAPPVTSTPAPPPPPPPAPATTSSTSSSTTSVAPGPPPPGPIVSVPGQGPVRCGPGAPVPKCQGNFYCDPQPLCSIGEDCPGVCLAIYNERWINIGTGVNATNAEGLDGRQPWNVRRKVWQDLLDRGEFVMYRYVQ